MLSATETDNRTTATDYFALYVHLYVPNASRIILHKITK